MTLFQHGDLNPDLELVLPTAASLVCAVEDEDTELVAELLRTLTARQLASLAVVLAAHVDPSRPFTPFGGSPIARASSEAARRFGVSVAELTDRTSTRSGRALKARNVAVHAAMLCGQTASSVGRFLGRDHSTILHARARAMSDIQLHQLAKDIANTIGRPVDEALELEEVREWLA